MTNGLDSIWLLGAGISKDNGWTFTSACMFNAYFGGGAKHIYYNDSEIMKKIKTATEYRNLINQWIQQFKTTGKRVFGPTVIEFNSIKDLHMSIQHITVSGNIQDDGNMGVTLHDTYNFDQIRTTLSNLSIPNAANDFGYLVQQAGIIKIFDIYIYGYEWAGKPSSPNGVGIDRFIAVAKEELAKGFKETNSNNITPYGAWYGMNGEPWCAMFVSWCANKSGILGSVVPMYAYCPYGVNWYESRGRYRRRSSGYTPNAGDVIMFQSGGVVSHTGIVINYDSLTKTVSTIEGNSGDAVAAHSYNLNNTYIHGYGVSDGAASGGSGKGTVDSSILLRMGSNGDAVKNLQTMLVAKGYNTNGVDGDFGQGTYNAVISFQRDHGLTVDGIVGSETWNALLNDSSSNNSYELLKIGSTGSAVVNLQNALVAKGYNTNGVDGDFGQGTYNAVVNFQRDHGLSVDGIVGPATWNALLNNTIENYSGLLKLGSTGNDVKTLQNALIARGYNCGASGADGDFGQGTYNAVVNFQRDHGLQVDGVVGSATWNALSNSSSGSNVVLKMGSTGDGVKRLQESLAAKGYNTNGVDGDFGPGTYNAVVNFQRDHGLQVDGIVGPATWNALNNSSNSTALLKIGSNGSSVANLQNALITRGYSCGASGADGDFGQGTYNAVVSFQRDHGLQVDGVVGPATWNALGN